MTLARIAAASAVLGLATDRGTAQQVPPPEAGQQIVNVSHTNGGIRMRDRETDAPLIDPRGLKLYDGYGLDVLEPTITVNKQPAGFDVMYTFQNGTNEPKKVGDFQIGIITLGSTVTWPDVRNSCAPVTFEMASFAGVTYPYPDDLYSPVWVVSNGQHAIGVSVLYPVLEYKHDVRVSLCKMPGQYTSGEGGMGWMVNVGCSNLPGWGAVPRPCEVPPGEERTYVVCVRVTKKTSEWVRTLLPYREYFRSLYGGVQYSRDADAVYGLAVAFGAAISPTNPSGWTFSNRRPDLHTWAPWVAYITTNLAAFKRVMIWAPSGLYNVNQELNYPFQFTSRWLDHPKVKTAIDPAIGLPRVKQKGQKLGLWWGRSLEVSTQWNPSETHKFDLHNAADVALALHELDVAIQAGATMIGLDTFQPYDTPLWDQITWLKKMNQRGPGLKFIFEPSACDIMHRLGPIVVDAFQDPGPSPQSPEALYRIKTPNYLADFLLPGHESWALMHWEHWNQYFNHAPSVDRKRQDCVKVAQYGFVPVIQDDHVQASPQFKAVKSWEQSIPEDLQGWPVAPGGELQGPPRGSSRYYDRAEVRRALEGRDRPPP